MVGNGGSGRFSLVSWARRYAPSVSGSAGVAGGHLRAHDEALERDARRCGLRPGTELPDQGNHRGRRPQPGTLCLRTGFTEAGLRRLREALALLASAALPDPGFADDMEAVLSAVGPLPDDPWARS
jgi:hypothetical protein